MSFERVGSRLVVVLLWYVYVAECWYEKSWTDYSESQPKFKNMLMSDDGQKIFVSGGNKIYQLNATDLNLLNKAIILPANSQVNLMIYNDSVHGNDQVMTCSVWNITGLSTVNGSCDVRDGSNVSVVLGHLQNFIQINNVVALTTSVNKSDNTRDNFLFLGCPHVEKEHKDKCEQPGLNWFLGNEKKNEQKFKSWFDTPVETMKYVNGYNIDMYRIFFSVQKVKSSGTIRSRVAQVCQDSRYSSSLTYADMSIKCGAYSTVKAVKGVIFDEQMLFIAVFADKDMGSAVCFYTFEKMKERFVENIKECYRGKRVQNSEDYLAFNDLNRPCKTSLTETHAAFNQSTERILCNGLFLQSYHHVIGEKDLLEYPALTLKANITSITVATVDSNVIAFLGSSEGEIYKAKVYPNETAKVIPSWNMQKLDVPIRQDMYTSPDNRHIYFFTERKVYKMAVENCAKAVSCNACLESQDPFCGWCFLQNRCSQRDVCRTGQWISASDSTVCPTVNVTPSELSDKQIESYLDIEISHELNGTNVSCIFYNEQAGVHFIEPARLGENNKHVICRPTDVAALTRNITGSMKVFVSIGINDSATPLLTGSFFFYKCDTFKRCSDCQLSRWTCVWLSFSNECKDNSTQSGQQLQAVRKSCPEIVRYDVSQSDVKDASGIVYLSRDREYTITATGNNLPKCENNHQYTCELRVDGASKVQFVAGQTTPNVTCDIDKVKMKTITDTYGNISASLYVLWKGLELEGHHLQVIAYDCTKVVNPGNNCGLCKSFAVFKPFYHCIWCGTVCKDSNETCDAAGSVCGPPIINKVYPMSAHPYADVTRVEITGVNLGITFSDTVDSVRIAGVPCISIDNPAGETEISFSPGTKITCNLQKSGIVQEGSVKVTLSNGAANIFSEPFHFRFPNVTSIEPNVGPKSGGTLVTIRGEFLDTGRERKVFIGQVCEIQSQGQKQLVLTGQMKKMKDDRMYLEVQGLQEEVPVLVCRTKAWNETAHSTSVAVRMTFDGADLLQNLTFSYEEDPVITSISPKESFLSGGRKLTVKGTYLYAIQKPQIYVSFGEWKSSKEICTRDVNNTGEIICPSPKYTVSSLQSMRKRRSVPETPSIGFVMDDVASVSSDKLHFILKYYQDPSLENLTDVKNYKDLKGSNLILKGHRLMMAATQDDVMVDIGCTECKVSWMSNEAIYCEPTLDSPSCPMSGSTDRFDITVKIGFWETKVGHVAYDPVAEILADRNNEYIVAGTVGGVLVLGLVVAIIVVVMMLKHRKLMQEKNKGLEYKLDKLEGTYRAKCREEFAALQTVMADLTSDLEGGNVLFRDYDVYASKTLFTSQKYDAVLGAPAVLTEQSQAAMETFRNLLRNRQFLLMFVRTLEKQTSFTIHDRSNVATILMVLNHDNMEYITGILTTLLADLIDKNIAANTPKLLLRRSECVAEKLLTHWLSICLYHFLKDRPGAQLFSMYKAIKILTEKGPIDYISNCGKYTLSEDRLITTDDTEIKPLVLTLIVSHTDYIDNTQKEITVQVLDCDTVTQAKNKMLEVLYKNVPYSQRPAVHCTCLEIEETDAGGGATVKRVLHDDDASSLKEGLWKRINTLQHYNVKDQSKVNLLFDTDLQKTSLPLVEASPDSFIVGSFRRSKPVVRTVSGSNFWHLTKKHSTEDEVHLSSEIFLPRLLKTKGTLQEYIDNLFQAVLSVGEETPIIIKYLFDFLDSAAARCGITDPDVVHTWKCNSLLLRFWVNIIKNPEFVFDIHKPQIVDACLSVIAQTLMDSCSTADLVLGPSSPSNKLLFAKDIPHYKTMVKQYFLDMKMIPAVSDQDLNSYLTQNVSQKFSGKFHQSNTLVELYGYVVKYKKEIYSEMDNLEASSPGSFSPLTSKLEYIFMTMDSYSK